MARPSVDRMAASNTDGTSSIISDGHLRHHEVKGFETLNRPIVHSLRRRAEGEGNMANKEHDKKLDENKKKNESSNVPATPATPAATNPDHKGKTDHLASYSSPLWMVQPYSASVWEQGQKYVISWGPNPDPVHVRRDPELGDHYPVDIRLMQGGPDDLKEVAVIKGAIDSSTHSFTWTIPANLPPAADYTIRLSFKEGGGADGKSGVDTYSHLFEISKKGDPRSTKSNVGEPLVMPQMGAVPLPELNKPKGGAIIPPAAPPNPFPAEKTTTPPILNANEPAAAKPVSHVSSGDSLHHISSSRSSIVGLAMALFGSVFLL
ncbi:hypothetical protein BG004_003988 [Podila humilis]|nr:hypothetical protein BG004_003988 [Podila humilis]